MRRTGLALLAWTMLAPTLGCGARRLVAEDPSRDATLGEALLREVAALSRVVSGRTVIYAAVILTAVYFLRRWVSFSIRVAWRLGWDPGRRLARGRSVLDLTLVLVAALLLLRPFFEAAPILAGLGCGVFALAVALALPTWVQDLMAGIEIAGRETFKEGDQIEVGEHAGTVRGLGLLRTRLRAGDGSTLTVPNRLLGGSTVRVGRDAGAVPISITVPASEPGDPDLASKLEALAALSPYRRSGSAPRVTTSPQGFVLTVQTWATRDSASVQRALDRVATSMLRPPVAPPQELNRADE